MSSFTRRLLYYGIGFGIGLVFVFFFFNNRGCSWLPENRVKQIVSQRIIFISERNLPVLKKLGIKENEIGAYIKNAEVYFSKSIKNTNPKIYHFEGPTKTNDNFVCQIVLYDDSFICELIPNQYSSKNAAPSNKGYGKPVRFPKEGNFFYSDSTRYTICKRKALGIIEDSTLMSYFRQSGRIDLLNSNLRNKPKPEHRLIVKDEKGIEIGFNATYYKEKAKVIFFEYDGEDCD